MLDDLDDPNPPDEPSETPPDSERVFRAFVDWVRFQDGADCIIDFFDEEDAAWLSEFQSTASANSDALEKLCELKPEHRDRFHASAEAAFEELVNNIRPLFEAHTPPWYECFSCRNIFIGHEVGSRTNRGEEMPLCYHCNGYAQMMGE